MAKGDAELAALAAALDEQRPACAGNSWFLADRNDLDWTLQATLRQICRTCPLVDPCGSYARRTRPQTGMWAGEYFTPRSKEN